jgi:hypothetical protein
MDNVVTIAQNAELKKESSITKNSMVEITFASKRTWFSIYATEEMYLEVDTDDTWVASATDVDTLATLIPADTFITIPQVINSKIRVKAVNTTGAVYIRSYQ